MLWIYRRQNTKRIFKRKQINKKHRKRNTKTMQNYGQTQNKQRRDAQTIKKYNHKKQQACPSGLWKMPLYPKAKKHKPVQGIFKEEQECRIK